VARIGLKWFDPDVKPPIEVSHNEPLIAKSDETVKLKFGFVCAYGSTPGTLHFNAILFVTYGKENEFTSTFQRDNDEEGYWSATLHDRCGWGALRYYLQVNDPQVATFPLEGTIDTFTVTEFIPIDLPEPKPVEPGELVLAVPWGSGPETVGVVKIEGYPLRQGPPVMDVAADGRIALLDFVNKRVLIYDPKDQGFTSISLPFHYRAPSDLQFDRDGQLAILDGVGEPIERPTVHIPRLYRMSSWGETLIVAPVFVEYPYTLTKDLSARSID
jgi:hypothetical protein